jgi:hypothetical protein
MASQAVYGEAVRKFIKVEGRVDITLEALQKRLMRR